MIADEILGADGENDDFLKAGGQFFSVTTIVLANCIVFVMMTQKLFPGMVCAKTLFLNVHSDTIMCWHDIFHAFV